MGDGKKLDTIWQRQRVGRSSADDCLRNKETFQKNIEACFHFPVSCDRDSLHFLCDTVESSIQIDATLWFYGCIEMLSVWCVAPTNHFEVFYGLLEYSSCAQVYVRTLSGKDKIIDSLRLIVLAL